MPRPDSKKPNLKPKADLAGWLGKYGSASKEPEAVKIVGPAEAEPAPATTGSDPDITGGDRALPPNAAEVEITGTNFGAPQSYLQPRPQSHQDVAITGTDVGSEPGGTSPEDDISPGQVIGDQYEIISLLGRGGMSAVYKAEDRLMRRVVAVKCLHAHLLSDKNSILRFQKEARAAGNLNHPHIVKIHQYGVDQNKRPFLVMDFLLGQSLQEVLDSGNMMETEDALRILSEAADGLDQAHKKGVVHRDFKPSNIMLVNTEEEKNSVKIVDFGIAKVIATPGEEGHNLTQTGEMLGSPNYMSPEQCMMSELDSRSDIYAFGCTMFAALTGSPPFSSGNLVEIYYKHMSDLPESISVKRPDIKEAAQLDAVILKCMAKEPCDRYQTMAEAKAAIQAIVDGGKQSLVESLKEQIELNRLKGKARKSKKLSLVAVGSVVVLVVAVGLGAYFSGHLNRTDEQNWHDYYVKGQDQIDTGDYKNAEDSLSKALAAANTTGKLADCIIPTIKELVDLSVIEGDAPKVLKYHSNLEKLKKQYENSSPDLDKQIQMALKQVDGGPVAGKDKLTKGDIEQLCQTINDQVRQLITDTSFEKALELLHSADHLARSGLEPGAPVQARTLHNMALAYSMEGETAKAYDFYSQAIQFIKTNLSPSDPALVKALDQQARIDWLAGRPELALSKLQQAHRIAFTVFNANSSQMAGVKMAMGDFYTFQKKSKQALAEIRQSWVIYQKDPNATREDKAHCLAMLSFAEPTLANLQEALKMQEQSPEKPSLAWVLERLGDVTSSKAGATQFGKDQAREKAVAYYKRALAVSYRQQPRDETLITELFARLEAYYFDKNEPGAMEPWYSQKIVFDQAAYGSNAPVLIDDYLSLAQVYRRVHKLDLCEKTLKQALEVAQIIAGSNDGNASIKTGEPTKTRETAETSTTAETTQTSESSKPSTTAETTQTSESSKPSTTAETTQTSETSKTTGDMLPLFKVKAALAALSVDRGLMNQALDQNKQALDIFEKLRPAQKSLSPATRFFFSYASLLDRLGRQEQAQLLKANHKVYFGN